MAKRRLLLLSVFSMCHLVLYSVLHSPLSVAAIKRSPKKPAIKHAQKKAAVRAAAQASTKTTTTPAATESPDVPLYALGPKASERLRLAAGRSARNIVEHNLENQILWATYESDGLPCYATSDGTGSAAVCGNSFPTEPTQSAASFSSLGDRTYELREFQIGKAYAPASITAVGLPNGAKIMLAALIDIYPENPNTPIVAFVAIAEAPPTYEIVIKQANGNEGHLPITAGK